MSGFFGGLVDKLGGALGVDLHAKLNEELGSLLQPDTIRDLVAKADQAGLGDRVRSWIGSGDNLPISADEIRNVLGSSQVQDLVARTGLPADTLLPALAHFLPDAVDKNTPAGTV
ncbi:MULTISPECIES: YidB family protein [Acetobacter]|nr:MULTISPECIES: YidB family protein [Acetobacter]MBO1360095.1 DUF937 domain-containing protein [Acetobacter sacchari]